MISGGIQIFDGSLGARPGWALHTHLMGPQFMVHRVHLTGQVSQEGFWSFFMMNYYV